LSVFHPYEWFVAPKIALTAKTGEKMGQKKAIPQMAPQPGLLLMNAVAISSTLTVTSATFNANNVDNIGIQVSFTGTPTGTLAVQCSIDNVNFLPLTFNPVLSQPAGSPLSYLIDLTQVAFPYLNVSYTNASGSGTLTVYLSAKDVN
jgi:hypothetical protein